MSEKKRVICLEELSSGGIELLRKLPACHGLIAGLMSVGRGTSEREAVIAPALDEPPDASRLDQLVEHCGLAFDRGVEL